MKWYSKQNRRTWVVAYTRNESGSGVLDVVLFCFYIWKDCGSLPYSVTTG